MMNPYRKYQQQQTPGLTRIELLLLLYDGAIDRLEKAVEAIKRNDPKSAKPLIDRSVLIVAQLAAGLDFKYGELPVNMLRLFEFAAHCLRQRTLEKTEAALKVLRELREGMWGIRDEANRLEQSGVIPPAGAGPRMQVLA